MNNLADKLASLSPAQRALLERRLKARKQQAVAKPPPIVHREVSGSRPLSLDQERLWFIDQLAPGNAAYNINVGIRFRGLLDVASLEKSINEVIKRHESLRTTFVEEGGEPRQLVAPELTVKIQHLDLQHLSRDAQEAEAEHQASIFAAKAFDLRKGPLTRYLLMQLGPTEHILVSVTHHIITDWWSSQVMVDELTHFYNAFVANRPPQLPDVAFQFTDFVLWERAYIKSNAMKKSQAYWRKNLAGGTFILDLPIAKPRPHAPRFTGRRQWLDFPPELIKELRDLSRRVASTLFTVLTAAYKTLLFRYTGQTDITMGGPLADRSQQEWENVIGFMITMLIYHTELTGDLTFKELVERERCIIVQSYAHKDVPFGELMKIAGVERDWNRNPLFQHSFIFLNLDQWHNAGEDYETLDTEHIDYDPQVSRFDTTLTIWDFGETFRAYIEYDTDLYDEADMARFGDHFLSLLTGIVAQPEQRLSDLPMLTDAERHQLLVECNDTAVEYDRDQLIPQLFEQQVARTPDAVAVVFQDQQLSFRELNARANQLAHHLQTLGVGPEVLVGICIPRSIEMVVGLLGILKAGGAYLPLDPAYPSERLAFMLDDAQVSHLLTEHHLLDQLGATCTHLFCLDRDWHKVADAPTDTPAVEIKPYNAAFVTYTSGSTGRPKGVIGLHGGIINRFQWMWRNMPFLPGEVGSQKTALSFLDSLWEIFGTLLQGVPLIIIADAVVKEPQALIAELAKHKVSRLVLVPSLLKAILESDVNLQERLSSLTTCVSSGEALTSQLAQLFHERMPHARLLNLYGSSEVSADVTWFDATAHYQKAPSSIGGRSQEQHDGAGVPIGRPIDNTQIYLLDARLQPVPLGIPGELYVGGDGLGRGYLNQPEMTRERFIPNPFGAGRLFKSGDLARWLPDGNLEYLGRVDHQVKIRGFRIELGEIEATLNNHSAVQQSVVTAREDTPGEKRLVAYVVPRKGDSTSQDAPLDVGIMRNHLLQKLPDYMVPAAFVLLERLPLTPSGKVNRQALPTPTDSTQLGTSRQYVAPQTAAQEKLASIWSEILTLDKISIHDNFFELGGHSLLAIRLITEIQTHFGHRLSLGTLFKNTTVAQLAHLLSQTVPTAPSVNGPLFGEAAGGEVWSPLVTIQPNGTRLPIFCLPGAGGNPYYLWELAQALGNDQPFYGLQPPGAEGNMPPLSHVDDLVEFFLDVLKRSEVSPPYLLGGHSAGAHIAFALALALEERGVAVPALVLMDIDAPGLLGGHHFEQAKLAWRDWETVGALALHVQPVKYRLGDRLPLSLEHLQTLTGEEAMHYVTDAYKAANLLPPDAGIEQIKRATAMSSATMSAIEQFIPDQKYRGQVLLFNAQDDEFSHAARIARGWQSFCTQPVIVHSVPGNHFTMLNPPHVQQLAKQIRHSLAWEKR